MLYALCALLCAGLIALDQGVKAWITVHIDYVQPLAPPQPFLPHILGLNNAHNTGAAWSILEEHTWILTIVSFAAVALILFVLLARKIRHPVGVITLSVILAGAAGNLIDRVRLGYVVDMFQTLFMDFPIFNVADICVVCGGIAFCIYFAFFAEKWEPNS